ncbi:MAG: TRAP transporter large permease subunit [Deinococcales bacterium]
MALASLVLGMGLPVTASYIVLAVLTAPALQSEFGIPLLIAHLLIFWYSQDSNVTPPVALAAFAGAGIAGADPMRTGFQAWKFAKGLYLIPLFMVFKPEIVSGGPPLVVLWQVFSSILALAAFAIALEGYFFTKFHPLNRLLGFVALVAMLWPSFWVDGLGVVCVVLMLFINYMRSRTANSVTM